MNHASHRSADDQSSEVPQFSEEIALQGHIIDSLLLPKILDEITVLGGDFSINEISVGQLRSDSSHARIKVSAKDQETLQKILTQIAQHGAVSIHQHDCILEPADMNGAFPEGFYCSTNQKTEIRIAGNWIPVDLQEMDCGIIVTPDRQKAYCLPMSDVQKNDLVIIGHQGTRVIPTERSSPEVSGFSFMNSTVSSEKPKGVTVKEIASEMQRAREGDGKILVVAGPAVVHTGSRDHLSKLIREGYVNLLFAGNALATHDIEESFYDTSLGISMKHGGASEEGHEHHLRSINRIRRLGSIQNAVDQDVLKSGIMYECVKNHVPFLLAGSIRDDGPLPDVITDSIEAQRKMRELVQDVSFCLMIATTLHSIAVGNLLPASVKVVCVDINPATVTKLADRGTFQTVGLVTDVEPFLRVLLDDINLIE